MPLRVECYFDYRSPFPYLALGALAEIAQRHGVEADWIPIRMPELSSYRDRPMGHSFPKRVRYVSIDCQRWARRRGIAIRTPDRLLRQVEQPPHEVLGRDHPLDTERALRAAVVARHEGFFDDYHEALNRALWGRGEDVAREEVLDGVLGEVGRGERRIREAIDSAETGTELGRLTREADDRGVFGVPTFFVGSEMFWGQDRLDFVEEELIAQRSA